MRNRKRFEALRNFTLESGQEEMERRSRQRKDAAAADGLSEEDSMRGSVDSLRSPTASAFRGPSLSNVPEDETFAIGDGEDDSDDEARPTPSQSSLSENPSRAGSVASVEDAVPTQLRGMSEKARGKMPAGARNFSRQNSTTSLDGSPGAGQPPGGGQFEPSAQWIETWLPELPLHTILALIQQLTALIPRQSLGGDGASGETLRRIREVRLLGVEPSPTRVHSFEWSPPALGWYESLMWSFVFSSELQAAKGTTGVWNGTAIRLFRVQETAPEGPSLNSPRGAVDAVGSNLVSRIGSINLRGAGAGGGSSAGAAPAGAATGAGAGASASPAGGNAPARTN